MQGVEWQAVRGAVGRAVGMARSLRSVLRFRRFALDPTQRLLDRVVCVEDLRREARRRLPGGIFDYIDGGAEDEVCLERNRKAFQRIEVRPRVLRGVSEVDTSTSLLGRRAPLPLILAPTGFTRIADPAGELAAARAAARAGIPYVLSTLGTRSIEEVAGAGTGRKWFQVYVWRDRGLVAEMIQRAREAGFEALCVTVDAPIPGRRERDVRRGFTLPPKIGLSTLVDGALHPGWTWRFLSSEPIVFANVAGDPAVDGTTAVGLADFMAEQLDPALSWRDVEWIRSQWDGPVIVKGIQTVEDAVMARDRGLDGLVLSNHGGRQLDSAPAAVALLPPVADAVGDDLEVICDGGVRRGGDILKAVSLGATACMVGRAYLYGLAAAGEAGVDWVIEHLRSSLERDMALSGAASVSDLTPRSVSAPA